MNCPRCAGEGRTWDGWYPRAPCNPCGMTGRVWTWHSWLMSFLCLIFG